MRELKNLEETLQMIGFYKKGKISKTALEIELTQQLSLVTSPIQTVVQIVEEKVGNTNGTFCSAVLPKSNNLRSYGTIMIDDEVVHNILTEEQVVKVLLMELDNIFPVVRMLDKFKKDFQDTELTLSETLAFFVDTYSFSLKSLESKCPETYKKLREENSLASANLIQEHMGKIISGQIPLEEGIEKLTINYNFPKFFVAEAKKMKSREEWRVVEPGQELQTNVFGKQIEDLTDGTYKNLRRDIPYNYKPKTNQ